MNESDLHNLLALHLKRDEGFRAKPYKCTADKLTIGYGRNLDDKGITVQEAEMLLYCDIAEVIEQVHREIPLVAEKPIQIRLGLYNMAFNLGINGLLKFEKMLYAIEKDDYELAAKEALDSKWAKQVGKRANRIAELFRDA